LLLRWRAGCSPSSHQPDRHSVTMRQNLSPQNDALCHILGPHRPTGHYDHTDRANDR
jgi:hypothetical protein